MMTNVMPVASMRVPMKLYPVSNFLSLYAVYIMRNPEMNRKKLPISRVVNILDWIMLVVYGCNRRVCGEAFTRNKDG